MAGNEPTVFVVDDDEAVRNGISQLIESVNLKVETFESAQQFLDSYDPVRPGCLLLDVRMPGMSGLKLQEKLAENNISIPIIFITGHGNVPMAAEAFKAGAVDFLEKPVGDQALLDRIQNAIAKDENDRKARIGREKIEQKLALLTAREQQVLSLVVTGMPNKTIAAELELSQRTIEAHRAAIMEKMQADSIAQLVTQVNKVKKDD
ncbi:MAG: response regulator transcription factor [Planctomycetes bacterium]|nr:response regulator transcription factor [Planctomycetota bacterium]